jgi:hypothetical protein
MKMGVPFAGSTTSADGSVAGLPRVSYYPPIVATLLAALLIFAIATLLAGLMVANTVNLWERAGSNEEGASPVTAGLCGIVSLVLLAGAAYLLTAVIKGARDLGAPLQYTRGAVVEQQTLTARKVKNWLLVDPAYSGPDLERATAVTDEQIAASVDRSEIVHPRFEGGFWASRRKRSALVPELEESRTGTVGKPSGYLSPERISAQAETTWGKGPKESTEVDRLPQPHVIFRADFAQRAQLRGGEEVIVAHSRYLQHPFYIARLINGEWQVHRNKALI